MSSSNTTNVPIERREASLGAVLSGSDWMLTGRGQHYFSGCAEDERVPMVTRISGSLTYVTDIVYGGRTYSAYQMSPTSALIMFQHVTEIGVGTGSVSVETPVTDLGGTISPGIAPSAGSTDTRRATYMRYRIIGRGSLITTVTSQRITIDTSLVNYPSLSTRRTSVQTVSVPLPTCTLPDQTIPLDDIDATTLAMPGPSAYSKRFDITMACNLAGKALRFTLRDATSTGNTGTELTPTTDSTAQGVRLQLLLDGHPASMNSPWGTSSVKGNITLEMAARYYRMAGPFLSGSIGAKVMFTVEYL